MDKDWEIPLRRSLVRLAEAETTLNVHKVRRCVISKEMSCALPYTSVLSHKTGAAWIFFVLFVFLFLFNCFPFTLDQLFVERNDFGCDQGRTQAFLKGEGEKIIYTV